MDWVVWSAVAQIVGSAAIVVTLIYLAMQIRQNTDAMQAAAREAIAERNVEGSAHGPRDASILKPVFAG